MIKENPFRRVVRSTLAVSILLGLPAINHESTGRVIKALQGEDPSCSSGESVSAGYPYDVIAVPGAGIYTDGDGNIQLNSIEKGRLQAAARAYISGYAPNILLLNGYDGLASDLARDYLQKQVVQISKDTKILDDDSIFVDEESINTATNVRYLAGFMAEKSLIKAVLITNDFHSDRVVIISCNYGINSGVITVETLNGQDYVDGQEDLAELILLKEWLEAVALAYDPLGIIPTALKGAVNNYQEDK